MPRSTVQRFPVPVLLVAGVLALLLLQLRGGASPLSWSSAVETPTGGAPVLQGAEPVDAPDGWAPSFRDATGRPVGWDPCTPVHYVVSLRSAPPAAQRDLQGAVERLQAVAGIRLVFDGLTDEVPSADRPAVIPERYGSRWAPVLVGWVRAADTDLDLEAHDGLGPVGVGGPTAVTGPAGPVLVTGQLALNSDLLLPPGFGPGATQGEVLLHEWGHVLGLAHVTDPRQLMFPRTTSAQARLGTGDRVGLATLRGGEVCRPAPPAM